MKKMKGKELDDVPMGGEQCVICFDKGEVIIT